jgi:hypothetical protein
MIHILKDAYAPRGLFAYVWNVMDVLNKLQPDDQLFVDLRWTTPYYDSTYSKTNNVWEYYFKQPFDLNLDCYKQNYNLINYDQSYAQNIKFGIDDTTRKYALYSHEELRNIAKKLIRNYLKPQDHIQSIVDTYSNQNFNNKKILGVHYRGGYHYINGHAANQEKLLDYNYYFKLIDEQLNDYDQLFLICLEKETKQVFKDKYKSKLLTLDSDHLGTKMGFGYFHPGAGSLFPFTCEWYKVGETAVVDCLLLSMCDKKIVTQSNLGFVSLLLNDNPYEFIDNHINYKA